MYSCTPYRTAAALLPPAPERLWGLLLIFDNDLQIAIFY